MHLIIGGAYQGKLSYAVRKNGLEQDRLYDLTLGFPDKSFPALYHLESLTKKASHDGMTAGEIFDRLMEYSEGSIIVSREIGSGIVPMNAEDRLYREVHGSLLRMLAERADTVTRIVCGLEEKLK